VVMEQQGGNAEALRKLRRITVRIGSRGGEDALAARKREHRRTVAETRVARRIGNQIPRTEKVASLAGSGRMATQAGKELDAIGLGRQAIQRSFQFDHSGCDRRGGDDRMVLQVVRAGVEVAVIVRNGLLLLNSEI